MKFKKIIFSILFIIIIYFIFYKKKYIKEFFNNNIYKNKKELTILTWPNIIDQKLVNEFEKKTGITIHISYFLTNEELIAKISANKDLEYDIIIPSDYTLRKLRKDKLIKEIDKEKIENIDYFDKKLINYASKDNNLYGIPFKWGIYGIAIKKELLNFFSNNEDEIINSFILGKKGKKNFRLCMSSDALACFNFIKLYYKNNFDLKNVEKKDLKMIIYEILKKQKEFVKCYSDERVQYLFENNEIDMALLQSTNYFYGLENNKNIEFLIPKNGALKTIEYISIFNNAKNIDGCYEFINFIISNDHKPDSINIFNKISKNINPEKEDFNEITYLEKGKKVLKKIKENNIKTHFIKEFISEKDLIGLWIKLKSF